MTSNEGGLKFKYGKGEMTNQIDGTKTPHHGLFYMENAGGHHLQSWEPASLCADERQSSCFAGEEEKGEDWKGGGGLKSAINEKLPSL
jgi:hypothetical protein